MGPYVDEAVASVLGQTFRDFEIIVVNDGSTDEATIRLLQDYERPQTRVLHTPNQGLPATRNHGIAAATGTYICCLDADDTYHPAFLARTVAVLDDDAAGRYGFVTTWVQGFGAGQFVWETHDFDVPALLENNVVHVASLFRRRAWEEVGGYNTDPKLYGYEDWNFWVSVVERGYAWHCIHEKLFNYRIREQSMLSRSNQMRPELVKQIYRYHKDLYARYAEEVIYLKERRIQDLYRERNQWLQTAGGTPVPASLLTKLKVLKNSRVGNKLIAVAYFLIRAGGKVKRAAQPPQAVRP
jgi:glycosyltransferase involved in cell wall biosynthesis